MNGKYYYGTGRRKSSVARVFMQKGTGQIIVNGRPVDEFFGRETGRMIVRQPLALTENLEAFDIKVNVTGGGETGQSGAIRHVVLQCHGINTVDYSGARALLQLRLQLAAQGIGLTLSEVKIPVKRQLERLSPPANWHQSLFLTHHQAIQTILASDPMPANPPATCPAGTHSGITKIEQRR